MPEPEPRRTVVVTGATGGIGAAVVAAVTARGDRVVAVARSAAALAARYADRPDVTCAALDLLDPQPLPPALATLPEVDGLLHCAGVADVTAFADTTPAGWRRAMAVDVTGPAELTRALLPALRQARGHVVFVGAAPGVRAVPGWAAYTAGKAAQRELADTLRVEEEPNGVRVTTVRPGAVGTDRLRHIRAAFGQPYDERRAMPPAALAEVLLSVLDQPAGLHVLDVTLRATAPVRASRPDPDAGRPTADPA